jgi:hypothetical protein
VVFTCLLPRLPFCDDATLGPPLRVRLDTSLGGARSRRRAIGKHAVPLDVLNDSRNTESDTSGNRGKQDRASVAGFDWTVRDPRALAVRVIDRNRVAKCSLALFPEAGWIHASAAALDAATDRCTEEEGEGKTPDASVSGSRRFIFLL